MFSHVKSDQPPTLDPTVLRPWLEDVVNNSDCSLKMKLRGNILHVYAQSAKGLDREYVLLRLVRSLLDPDRKAELLKDFPQIYQLYFYSGRSEEQKPDWSTPIYLNRLERHLEQLVETSADLEEMKRSTAHLTSGIGYLDDATSAIVLSNASLARKGDPDAIARYLSQTLSALDVGVDVVVNALPGKAKRAQGVITAHAVAADPRRDLINRLWILCRAAYSPDPAMIAEPTAQRLRDLKLTQFQDAVISVQVLGEDTPDWRLRVDLTPDEEILKEWSRWGDTESITRLLNQALAPLDVSVLPEVKDSTLHLVCQPLAVGQTVASSGEASSSEEGSETEIMDAIAPLLEQLAPQGVGRAIVYGPSLDSVNPVWLKCLDLPASEHADLAVSTQELARQGDLPAIAYCLTKQLNPDLDEQLSTGGIRVQLLRRERRLHIMIDAPTCPLQRQVVPQLKQYLRQHPIKGLVGIRIYGRRAGQKRPDWNYGFDRQPKKRLVPEAVPEFAASDAYLGDLIQQDETADGDAAEQNWPNRTLEHLRSLLIKTQLFASAANNPEEPLVGAHLPSRRGIALAWATLGLLLAFQADWIAGQLFKARSLALQAQQTTTAKMPERKPLSTFEEELAQLNWGQKDGDASISLDDELPGFASSAINDSDLLGSPLQTTVSMTEVLESSPFPSFTSQQLNEKLALYDWRVAKEGPPDVLIFGSSRALRGVDPSALKRALGTLGHDDVSIFNFGVNGATAQIADLVIRQLLSNYPLPKLIIWADGARAFNSSRVDVTFNAIATSEGYQQLIAGELFPENNGEAAGPSLNPAQRLNRFYARTDEQLSDALGRISSAYGERTQLQKIAGVNQINPKNLGQPAAVNPTETDLIDVDGFLPLAIQFNPATYYLAHPRVAGTYDGDYKAFQMEGPQVNALRQLVAYTRSKGVDIVFVNTPLTDEYLDPARLEVEGRFQRYMLQIAAQESGLLYRDLGQLWPQRYDYFSDPSHLNRFGAYQLSNRIAQDPMIPWLKLKLPAEAE
ncbi:SGNH/GDSL hydrolase family protein [Adonisia turfae]|uniref:SGNH/GDSL hydrolase family protein n=1 Tax=Adonisia turfae CCMR0081 TaxID=2292702 RepID=A0A6M0RSJ9_9CYAN|nr:SGNH/GDSL hydrolase family protein [Adonisia turfae]NEZ59217.1 SGNH/GDSL hydrolase family protein [Adonisia turfae CCMR0081]